MLSLQLWMGIEYIHVPVVQWSTFLAALRSLGGIIF